MLVRALEAKDRYTAGHAERVANYARLIGEELRFTPARLERLRFAALMHDIGKLVVPNHLLNKAGKLTAEEFARVRMHEAVSATMLSHIDFLAPVAHSSLSEHTEYQPDDRETSHRALHRDGRRRVRRDDVDPLVPSGARDRRRDRGAARQVGHAVPPRRVSRR